MDTSSWLSIIEFLIFSNMFKVMLCMELGDHYIVTAENKDNGGSGYEGYETQLSISLHPTQLHVYMNQHADININYTVTVISDGKMEGQKNNSLEKMTNISYVASIMSENPHIVLALGHRYNLPLPNNSTENISILLHANKSNMFTVKALCVGHASLIIQVTSFLGYLSEYDFESNLVTSAKIATFTHIPYKVTVVRKLRFVDFIFDWVITVIAVLNSFSIGCTTEWSSLRMHLRHPTSILLAACCQFIIMPTISLAIAKALGMMPELGLGLFYIACVPGGGLGHVMVSITGGDHALSVAINCVTTLATIAPLWIFAVSRFLANPETDHKLYWFIVWLVSYACAYILGVFLRYIGPKGADAYLNWFAKPFLLLYSILFITLGVYINMYMFSVLDHKIMVGAALLPLLGYAIGMFISYISRQDSEYVKTIATETTMSNCLLVLAIERFSMSQPDADVTSALPMWVLFTSLIPFLLSNILKKIHLSVGHRCAKRRDEKYRHFSIVSSLLNITNVTTLSSSITPKMASPVEENCTSLIDEKITVL